MAVAGQRVCVVCLGHQHSDGDDDRWNGDTRGEVESPWRETGRVESAEGCDGKQVSLSSSLSSHSGLRRI